MSLVDSWQVTEGEHDGNRLVARFNLGAKPLAGNRGYTIQIGVAVPFNERQEDGMPSASESDQLTIIEDHLVELVRDRGVLVGVLTTNGMREFVLYTRASDWIEGLRQALQASVTSHEVQVMFQSDPRWTVYGMFVQ